MDLLADRVILLSEPDHLAELCLELFAALAERQDLALADGNGAPAVRVRNIDVRKRIGEELEEFGVLLQIRSYCVRCHDLSCLDLNVRQWSRPSRVPVS